MPIIETEKLQTPIEIKKVKPSELTLESLQTLGLIDLVTKGYGFKGTPLHLLGQTIAEYDGEEERTTSYLAILEGKAVGSLAIRSWSIEDEKVGKMFWKELSIKDPTLYNKSLKFSTEASKIAGIITHPDYRNRKIARQIYKFMVEDMNPSFIIGDTKTPEAVLIRASALSEFGYRTFFGNSEVTPQNPKNFTEVHLGVLESEFSAAQCTLENGIYYEGVDILLPTIPAVSMFPKYIQESFKDLIEAQVAAGDGRTATKPLISIRSKLLS